MNLSGPQGALERPREGLGVTYGSLEYFDEVRADPVSAHTGGGGQIRGQNLTPYNFGIPYYRQDLPQAALPVLFLLTGRF